MTDPAWKDPLKEFKGPPLAGDLISNACVMGAGIAGLTTAYLLAKAGLRVVVLESKAHRGAGETAYTTAHLSCVIDDRFSEVERIRGEDVLRLAVESHAEAIDFIERTAAAERIDCDFRRLDGYLFLSPGDPDSLLDKEAGAAGRIGLAFERLPSAPLPSRTRACLRFPDQGRFHPLKYLAGLHRALGRFGVRVFTHARAERIRGGSPCQVMLKGGRTVTADRVVVATNTPINDVVSLHTKQCAVHDVRRAALGPAGVPDGAVLGHGRPVPLRPRQQEGDERQRPADRRRADHKTRAARDPDGAWDRLETLGARALPAAGRGGTRWSGQVMETLDGLGVHRPGPRRARRTCSSPPATPAWA